MTPHGETMRIIRDILSQSGTTLNEARGPSRAPKMVSARWAVARYLRLVKGWSYPRIGEFLNRDHSTIVHAIKSRMTGYERARATELQQRHAGVYFVAGHDPAPPEERSGEAAPPV